MSIKNRLEKLEKQQPDPARPAWVELDGERVIFRMENGDRIEARREDIPPGVKVYQGISPDDWNTVRKIDYRAGIVDDTPSPPGSIPVRWVEVKQEGKT